MKRFFCAVLAAVCLLAPAGCISAPRASQASSAQSSAVSAPRPEPAPAEADRAEALLASLTPEQRVGQLFFARCPASGAAEDAAAYHLGGFVLFGRDFKDLTANEIIQTLAIYQDAARADTGIPLLLGTDEEGGSVVRVSSNPHLCRWKFRSPQQLFAAGGLEEVARETHRKDVLLKALGVNVNLGPVCDVSADPDDFIYPRAFGQDAQATAGYASCVAETMAKDGMGTVLKHFPGYGNNADTHTGSAVDTRPLERFTASDFVPFQAGADAAGKTAAVLVSHNIMTAADDTLPASLSPAVHTLLRQTVLGSQASPWDGVAMTDDLAMDAVRAYAQNGSAAVLALRAGSDLLLTTDYRAQIPQVLAALKDGSLEEGRVDEACLRVLRWKLALGLL
ncbi:MAG: beta-hexosaminidase [Oscillibacter sp.]|jgi:beta-N-acetylhexosaminidase|nr:beta-hexosaminidase [Oscillibacter sp.]